MLDKTKLNSRLLYLVAVCTDFVAALLIFSVTRDLAARGAGLLKMGMAGGGFSFAYAVSSFVFGRLSDRVGRYLLIRRELRQYSPDLGRKRHVVAANKMDLTDAEGNLRLLGLATDAPVYPISAVTGKGLHDLMSGLLKELDACS